MVHNFIEKSEKYNYFCRNDRYIIFTSKNEMENYVNNNEIKKIVSHTSNTWQKDRDVEEIKDNTTQGKKAEDMFEDFIRFKSTNKALNYISYDNFRSDNLEKHAPFDPLC